MARKLEIYFDMSDLILILFTNLEGILTTPNTSNFNAVRGKKTIL